MNKIGRQRLRTLGISIIVGTIVMFSLQLFTKSESMRPNSRKAILNYIANDDRSFEASLLIDSIVSIVQSYYVDSDRIDNATILAKAIGGIGDFPEIHQSETDDAYLISIGDASYQIKKNSAISYDDLITELYSLSAFIELNASKNGDTESESWYSRGDVLVLNSLLTALDAHSTLMSADNYRELKQGTEGAFGGIGVVVSMKKGLLTISKPIPNSPATRTGLQSLDQIISINDRLTFGYTLNQLVDLMRGPPGSNVDVGILSPGSRRPKRMTMQRELITVDSVTKQTIKDGKKNLLHLMIESFSSRTSEEVAEALQSHRRQHNGRIDGLILDMRSNPGGLLDQAVEVANLFIKSGTLVSTKGRREEVEASHDGQKELDFPMVAVINEDSASASEIVAGALQDHQRAVIVGQPSFGKGSVQTIFELPGQQALKLTIARYYTPSGKSIQNTGIIPDIWLQPLYERDQNQNLLGLNRHKNERFLKNSLESGQAAMTLSAKTLPTNLKAYYRRPVESELDADTPLTRPDDHYILIARKILTETRKTYPHQLTPGTNRSSHWVAIATPTIKPILEKLNLDSSEWLSERMRIRWDSNEAAVRDEDLELELIRSGRVEAIQGEVLEIPWKIQNLGQRDINRVSVYATPLNGGFEPIEILVGKIDAKSSRRGVLKLTVPASASLAPSYLRIGAAVDSLAALSKHADLTITAKPRTTSELVPEFQFLDGANSSQTHRLDANESAKFRMSIYNRGIAPTRSAKLRIVNLSGKQVQIEEKSYELGSIGQSERKSFEVPITAEADLDHRTPLHFGIEIVSDDLAEPIRETIVINEQHATKSDQLAH